MNFYKNEKTGLLFSLPSLIIAFIFSIYPLIKTFIYAFSFTDEKGKIVEFAGFENFIELFTDPIQNTFHNQLPPLIWWFFIFCVL